MLSTYGDTDIPYFATCTVARCSKISHFLLLILNKASKKISVSHNVIFWTHMFLDTRWENNFDILFYSRPRLARFRRALDS